MGRHVALAELNDADLSTLADEMGWLQVGASPDGDASWLGGGMDARITWHQVDSAYGALIVEGSDAELLLADLANGFALLDDVDVLDRIAAATTPRELAGWVPRLAQFARGTFQQATFGVMLGLLTSERMEFVAAMVQGLRHARWQELLEPLEDVARRHMELKPFCEAAIASIKTR